MSLKTGITAMVLALFCAGAVAVFALLNGTPQPAAAARSATEPGSEPLVRSDPGFKPQRERALDPTQAEAEEPAPEPEQNTRRTHGPEPPPEPQKRQPEPAKMQPAPPSETAPAPRPITGGDPPEPTSEDVESAHRPRHYDLPDGAVMGLTIEALGIHDVPVFDSVGEWALGHGVGHHPETSMPWSNTPQRNVYLAGHRLGFPGTDSHLIFYRLDELGAGDEILLRDRGGKKYRYGVSEAFKATPEDSWVTGQVRDRDMVTLQTCSGPNWERRLIVRADRK